MIYESLKQKKHWKDILGFHFTETPLEIQIIL